MQFPTDRPTGGTSPTRIKLASIYPPASPGSIIGIVSQPYAPPPDDTFEDVTSANDHLIVHDYAPTSAVFTTPVLLTVLLTCIDMIAKDDGPAQLRLNVDGRYVPTSVRPGPKSALELHAMLSADFLAYSDRRLLLSIHAYRNDKIFDSCDFGFLTALEDQVMKPAIASPSTPGRPRKRLYYDFESSDEDCVSKSPSRYKKAKHTTRANAGRSKRVPPLLVVKGDLSAVADSPSWSKAEEYEGRRLVLFSRHQTGHRIQLSLRPITRAELAQIKGITVSCLKPPGEGNFYITSVDLLRLITFLINPRTKDLSIDEKSRIRRSLEGFKPITVKKNHPESIGLFNYLMCIMEPRPITIAKDIKIFRWCTLKAALTKILAKYDYDLESNELFENGMGRKVSYPPVPPDDRAAEASTSNHVNTVNETPSTLARHRLYSFPLKLSPIRFVVPEVLVQNPDNSRPLTQLASGHSRYAGAPSPSGWSIPGVSGASNPPEGTAPATLEAGFLASGSEVLGDGVLKRLHQRPRHQEDDNYDDDGDGSDMVYAQDRLLGVQDIGPASPSQASSGSAADEKPCLLPTTQTNARAKSSQEHINLSYSYDPDAPLLETKLGRYSPDDTADALSVSLHQFSRPHTVPPAFRHAPPRSRTAFVGADTRYFIRVPPCTPTRATSGELESSVGGPIEDFVGLFFALEDHQQLANDVDDDDEDCFSGRYTSSV